MNDINEMEYTRKDYMSGKCNHEQFYNQFVTPETRQIVLRFIGINALINSKDNYFNDIPLRIWDRLPFRDMTRCGSSLMSLSLAENVCIYKRTAGILKEEYLAESIRYLEECKNEK